MRDLEALRAASGHNLCSHIIFVPASASGSTRECSHKYLFLKFQPMCEIDQALHPEFPDILKPCFSLSNSLLIIMLPDFV